MLRIAVDLLADRSVRLPSHWVALGHNRAIFPIGKFSLSGFPLDIVCTSVRFGKYQDRMMCARSNKLPGTLHLGAACLGRHCGNDRQKTRESRRGLIRLCSIA
jgi:hypothetical protein